jgi:hypothetical protein
MGTTIESEKLNREFDLDSWCDESPEFVVPESIRSNRILYGLPCAHCKAYYDAEPQACPVCGCAERISPTAADPPLAHKRAA